MAQRGARGEWIRGTVVGRARTGRIPEVCGCGEAIAAGLSHRTPSDAMKGHAPEKSSAGDREMSDCGRRRPMSPGSQRHVPQIEAGAIEVLAGGLTQSFIRALDLS